MAYYKESDPFYHSAVWKRVRAAALARDRGMCSICMERMAGGLRVKPHRATLVHHVIPRTERPDLSLSLQNLQSLCPMCHNQLHPEKRKSGGSNDAARRTIRIIKV